MRAEEAAEKVTISLRALLDMVRDPVTAAETAERRPEDGKEGTEKEERPLRIPRKIVQAWIELVPLLENSVAHPPEHEEVFPPGLAEALKDKPEVPFKAEHLQISMERLKALAVAVATPGKKPEERQVTVPRMWIDALMTERTAFALQSLERWQSHRDKTKPLYQRQGTTTALFGDGEYHQVTSGPVAAEGNVLTAPYGERGTWNLYQLINRPTTWLQAEAEAAEMPAPFGDAKIKGHLVSIRSRGENLYVTRMMLNVPRAWIGLNDRRIECGSDKNGPWEWTSGEPVDFRNWQPLEPNNAKEEDACVIVRDLKPEFNARWMDYADGTDATRAVRFPYIVEWNMNAPAPVEGAKLPTIAFAHGLQGKDGDDGSFGVRIVYNGGSCVSLGASIETFRKGTGRVVEEKIATLHHGDPDGMGYPMLFGAPQPLPGHKPGAPDTNTALLVRGKIHIAETGTYTFGVHHVDGFAFRMEGAKWKSTSGVAVIDPAEPETIENLFQAGPGTSHGVVELAAGDYAIEFFGFQSGVRGGFELYAAKGEFQQDSETDTWRLVGHKAGGAVPLPGLAAPGWEVETTPPNAFAAQAFDVAERALQRKGVKLGAPVSVLAFADPDGPAQADVIPTVPFPEGVKGKDDDFFALRAKATLEVPADGKYWIGFDAMQGGRLSIRGQKWKRVVMEAPGHGEIDEEILQSNVDAQEGARILGEIELKAGKYELEYLGVHGKDPRAWDVVHCAGPGVPIRMLRVGEATTVQDFDGLGVVK